MSIGASDLNERVFSYDDLPPGQVDPELNRFSLAPDRADVIPVLKEILKIAPDIKIMGSPWSPPVWMKSNQRIHRREPETQFYGAYAKYFVKYIEGMRAEGVRIDAIAVQNEPLHPGNNPSLLMQAPEQAEFIKNHLAPRSSGPGSTPRSSSTTTTVIGRIIRSPSSTMSRQGNTWMAPRFISTPGRLTRCPPSTRPIQEEPLLHRAVDRRPRNLGGDLAWHTRELTIGATRNWSRTVLEWNLASDSRYRPHTPEAVRAVWRGNDRRRQGHAQSRLLHRRTRL